MSFEWNTNLTLVAILVGLSPLLVGGVRKAWKWYHRNQSFDSKSIQERLKELEKEEEE